MRLEAAEHEREVALRKEMMRYTDKFQTAFYMYIFMSASFAIFPPLSIGKRNSSS